MNKISRDTFAKLSADLLALPVTSQEMLEKLIDAVFDKALEDVFFQVRAGGRWGGRGGVASRRSLCRRTCTRTCASCSATRPSTGPSATSRCSPWRTAPRARAGTSTSPGLGQWQGPHATESRGQV